MVSQLSDGNSRDTDTFATACCRSCGEVGLKPILSLGETPLANNLLTDQTLQLPEPRFPLELGFCPECALVQITVSVPPEELFGEYAYFSSFSETMLQHAQKLSQKQIDRYGLGPDSRVLEVASNDGYLLQYYQQQGIPVLGIEPARNIAEHAINEKQIPTRCEFFGTECANKLAEENLQGDVIHANNVLAHVPDLVGVVSGFRTALKPEGVVVIEAPYLKNLLDHVEFDTIYHEHLFYFSLTALDDLFTRMGLTIIDVERIAIHGGSIRVTAARSESQRAKWPYDSVAQLLAEEQSWGVSDETAYAEFSQRVANLKQELCELIGNLKAENKRIAVYGASAKGSTLLNHFGLSQTQLDYVVDRSTVKQGHYTPGTHLKIFSPEKLVEDKPDYVLLLTWNFADEILEQQKHYREQGGKFIIPVPSVKVA